MVCTNIPIRRKNNKECKIALGQGGREKIKEGKKRNKMKENNLEFTIN